MILPCAIHETLPRCIKETSISDRIVLRTLRTSVTSTDVCRTVARIVLVNTGKFASRAALARFPSVSLSRVTRMLRRL